GNNSFFFDVVRDDDKKDERASKGGDITEDDVIRDGHIILIDYDKKTGKWTYDNTWGDKSDGSASLDAIYEATKPVTYPQWLSRVEKYQEDISPQNLQKLLTLLMNSYLKPENSKYAPSDTEAQEAAIIWNRIVAKMPKAQRAQAEEHLKKLRPKGS